MDTFNVETPAQWTPLFLVAWLVLGIILWRIVGTKFVRSTAKTLGRVAVAFVVIAGAIVFLGLNSSVVRVRHVRVAARADDDTLQVPAIPDTLEVRTRYDWQFHTYPLTEVDYYDLRRSTSSPGPEHYILTLAFKDGVSVEVSERKTNYQKLRAYLERKGIHKRAPYERPMLRPDKSPRG